MTTFTLLNLVFLTAAVVPFAIGMLTIFHFVRAPRSPADTSNRINRIRLWWFALTRPELFVDSFPWLKHDELDNVGR